MNILSLIKDIFTPAVELIDELHTSEDERLTHKAKMLGTYVGAIEAGLEYEQKNMEQRVAVIKAEANSEHKLAAVWRPITMLGFLVVVMNNYVVAPYIQLFFDVKLPILEIGDEMWSLLQIGIGGYVASRGIEKVAPQIVDALKKKDNT